MATEYSIQKMVSDGTLSTITLGIQYLQRNDIYIRIAGEETPQSGAPSGYTWSFLDNTTLKILPVVPNGVEVVVYRRTDVDAMYNIYSQNAQFDEATIDENNQQLLYIAQEYLEQGIPGAGVDTLEFVRDDGTYTYYRIKRTDGSYSDEFAVPSAGSVTKILAREALRRSYAEAGYALVVGSFEQGGTVATATDVLLYEATGVAYSYSGALPKAVPAGSSPATTGGIGAGAWLSVGDASAYSRVFNDLALSSGSSSIGDSPGWSGVADATVNERIIDLWSNAGISYENMGAVLDGVADDTAVAVATHALAKSLGIKVRQHGGVAKVSGTTPIEFATDCEFTGGFKFRFDSPGTGFLFDVTPEYTPIELTQAAITIAQFTKGAAIIPSLSAYAYHYAVIESSEIAITRVGGQQYTKKCVTVIGENGRLLYPLTFGFGSITKITLSPINIPQREISGLAFEINGSGQFALPVRQRRNNVRYINTRYIDGSTTGAIPVRQLWTLIGCFNTHIKDPVADTLSLGRVAYNYVVNGDGYASLLVDGMLSFEGWAQIDGDNCRDVTTRDSSIYRAGGHFNCWDYSFENITAHSAAPISISGGGRLDVENIRLMPSALVSGPNAIVDIRQDYGAQWDGDIVVDGVTIDMTGCTTAATLYGVHAYIDSSSVVHDFGVNLILPRSVSVRNVSLLLNEANTNQQHFQAVRLGGSGTLAGSRTFTYPRKINVSNVEKSKGSKTVNNEINSVYILGATPATGTNNEMHINVHDVDRDDPRFASLNPYDSGQNASITVPSISGLIVTLEASDCQWLRVDFSAAGYAKLSNCLLAAVSGSGRYEMFDCQYPATAFSGTWKGLMAGGVVRSYTGVDLTLKQVGFPNDIETNIAAARGVFVEVGGAIKSITQTLSTIQTGFYDTSYYDAP